MHRLSAACLACLAMSCSSPRRVPREPAASEPTLALLTYNVNYGLAGDQATLAAIEDVDAEVVVLQETTPEWERVIRSQLADRYEHMLFRHSGGAGGLAILSRHPLRKEGYLPSPSSWFPAWRLIVESNFGPVQLLAVHLRPPVSDSGSVVSGYFSTQDIRAQEIDAYLQELDPELPTVIAGDLNERNGEAIELLNSSGYRSALPEFQGRAPTWRWNTSVGTIRSQLDHVLYDSRLVPLDARVLQTGRSDHLPVLVLLTPAS